jgi:hypothetical protein
MKQTTVFLHAFVLGAVGLAASGIVLFIDTRASALVFSAAISALFLCLLDRARIRLSPLTVRSLADLVLMTPLVLVIFGAR